MTVCGARPPRDRRRVSIAACSNQFTHRYTDERAAINASAASGTDLPLISDAMANTRLTSAGSLPSLRQGAQLGLLRPRPAYDNPHAQASSELSVSRCGYLSLINAQRLSSPDLQFVTAI